LLGCSGRTYSKVKGANKATLLATLLAYSYAAVGYVTDNFQEALSQSISSTKFQGNGSVNGLGG